MMSDESENDGVYVDSNENDLYYRKYKLLLEECAQLQKSNEILVYRIQEINKIVKRRHKESEYFREILKTEHGEDWTTIPEETLLDDEDEKQPYHPNLLKDKIKEEKFEDVPAEEKPERIKPAKKSVKRKGSKTERDPNAPKRPSNPFFQFCQEQRQILQEQLTAELKPGEVEPTKQELTRQLAIKWKSLSVPDKKVYVDMYTRSKEKYAAELSEYRMKQ